MRKTACICILWLAWASPPPAPGQPAPPTPQPPALSLPPTKQTPVNFPVFVAPDKNDGGEVRWLLPDTGLREIPLSDMFPAEIAGKAVGRIFYSTTAGRYRVWAVSAKGDVVSNKAECVIIIGDAPPPGPGPIPPTPPGPGPIPIPNPPPIPTTGFRVLMVYDKVGLSKLPKEQLDVLYGGDVRDYLNAHCVKGVDGKTSEWRIWDKDVAPAGEEKLWQDAMSRNRTQLPWIVVSNGTTGYEGPLPATIADTLTLLKKYGGD